MPTYEYRCKACGHRLEIVQAFTDDALTRCEACGAHQLRKVFGSVGISFKGSGFYKNDSRRKTASAASSTTPSTGGDKGGSSDGGATTSTPADGGSSSTPASAPASTSTTAPA